MTKKHIKISLFLMMCLNCIAADELAAYRLGNLTNHLIKAENGITMTVRYTKLPDESFQETFMNTKDAFPHTNTLANITLSESAFEFDEAVQTEVFKLSGGTSITNRGWVIGRRNALNATGGIIGTQLYYWSPERQFSSTIITNGTASPGGWVEDISRQYEETAKNIVRLCMPQVDSKSIRIGRTNAVMHSRSGDLFLTVISNSPAAFELKFTAPFDPDNYILNRYSYSSPNDVLPTSVDCFIYIGAKNKTIHQLNIFLERVEYFELGHETTNFSLKIEKDLDDPKFQGRYIVTRSNQTHLIETNSK